MPERLKEPSLLRLKFLGQPMATLGYSAVDATFALEFDAAFLSLGHDLSPLHLPIEQIQRARLFRVGDSPFAGGLPGLIADSLPDAWGERMLGAEVPGLTTLLGKLAAIGDRGWGAISFEPVLGQGADTNTTSSNFAELAREAARLAKITRPLSPGEVDQKLAKGGSTLGGAYPKTRAHLPLKGETLEVRELLIGGAPPAGYTPCIVKFSAENDEDGGAVEFAFLKMAKSAGIQVPRAALVNDGQRRHFAVERFDRYVRTDGSVGRRHVHSLSGLLHRRASDDTNPLDYEDFMRLSRRLVGAAGATECFRRAVFNLLATNRDDHGRNHAYLYDETTRTWSIAPAYDLNPNVSNVLIGLHWIRTTQIPSNFSELIRLAELGGISRGVARTIFTQVETAVFDGWPRIAAEAGVPKATIEAWTRIMLPQTQALRADFHRAAPSAERPTGGAPTRRTRA